MMKEKLLKLLKLFKLLTVILFLLLVYLGTASLIGTSVRNSNEMDSLRSENKELKEQIRVLENEVQLREDEITYWGMKYDSIANTR